MGARCCSSTSTWRRRAAPPPRRDPAMMNTPSKFAFQDEGEALRRLGVDRDTLLALVREGRLRAYRGFGAGSFFRTQDLDDLYVGVYGGRGEAQAAAGAELGAAGARTGFDA